MNPYAWAIKLRNLLYDKGLLKSHRLSVPVISVGNLSVGGSGKTSLVLYLARHLQERKHVCILSRGYKRRTKGTLLVSYKGKLLCGWEESGDEPYMMASLLTSSSVVVDEDRYRGGLYAVRELGAQVILLDDGFQHRRLFRDLDIVVLKERDLRDRLLPFGRLREPVSSLRRAHALVLSYQDVKEWDYKTDIPTFKLYRANWRVCDEEGKEVDVKGREFMAFAGLGDNGQFFKTLEKLEVKMKKRLSFPDHYHYRDFNLERGQEYITTLKDFVKLKNREGVYYLDYDVKVEGLLEFVEERLNL